MAAIRQLEVPIDSARVETGPVQFGDDWPGIFIRGDDAGVLAMFLQAEATKQVAINQLSRLLASAIVGPAAAFLVEGGDGGG